VRLAWFGSLFFFFFFFVLSNVASVVGRAG